MSLTYYENLARDHWKQFLPKRYAELRKGGKLDDAITTAAKLTDREMAAALDAGVTRDQAWEEIRGRYLLLDPEPEEPDDEDDNPNQEWFDLIREIHEDTMKAHEAAYDNHD